MAEVRMGAEITEGEQEAPDPATIQSRNLLRAQFQLAFRNYPEVLERILRILHFLGPCLSEKDMALQNAAKSILHECGWWGDDELDRINIIRKLTGLNVGRRTFREKVRQFLRRG